MSTKENNLCTFYASDYHLEMIMLPYINNNLKENKNIYVFTQNNLEETIHTLVDNVNLKEEMKDKILNNIDWKNNDIEKYTKLIKDKNETIIFVKGNENYIEKVNTNLDEIKNYKQFEIVDCYDLNEINTDMKILANNHKSVLKTTELS